MRRLHLGFFELGQRSMANVVSPYAFNDAVMNALLRSMSLYNGGYQVGIGQYGFLLRGHKVRSRARHGVGIAILHKTNKPFAEQFWVIHL